MPSDDANFSIASNFNIDPAWLVLYQNYYNKFDPTMRVMAKSEGQPIINHVSQHGMQLDHESSSLFLNEVMAPQAFASTVAFPVTLLNKAQNVCILMRNKNQGDFTCADLPLLRDLQLHFEKAFQLSFKLWEERLLKNISINLLENSDASVILLNQRGELCLMSEQIERDIFQASLLRISAGKIQAVDDEQNNRFQTLLANALALIVNLTRHLGGVVLRNELFSAQLAVMPIHFDEVDQSFGLPKYIAIVLSNYRTNQLVPVVMLKGMFLLTENEADVMAKIVSGMTVQEISKVKYRSIETIRAQLKSVMKKTNTRRQADLIRLAATSIARFL